MKIKATIRYHYISIRTYEIKRLITPKAGMEQLELLCTTDGNVMFQAFWKTVEQFLKKLNIHLLYDPPILLLSIYPREMKRYVHTQTYTSI